MELPPSTVWNFGHQPQQQVPLLTEPSDWPCSLLCLIIPAVESCSIVLHAQCLSPIMVLKLIQIIECMKTPLLSVTGERSILYTPCFITQLYVNGYLSHSSDESCKKEKKRYKMGLERWSSC